MNNLQTTLRANPIIRRFILFGTMGLLTLAMVAMAFYTRQVAEYAPATVASLADIAFETYETGIVFQELVIPLALIYLISNTGPFRRSIGGETAPRDMLKLWGMLTGIQLIAVSYSVLSKELVTFGVLTVIVAGILGHWRLGLGVGLVTMLMLGTQELVYYPDEDFLRAYQSAGLFGLLDLPLLSEVFFWYYISDLGVSSAVWAGVVAGLWALLLGERRFNPLIALSLGIGISLGVILPTAISWEYPEVLTPFLIPGVVVTGLAMAAFALIARNVQAQTAQRKAEAAQLALTQAELRALRAQINPHFLFNALNTIRYFVRTDAGTARDLLLDLSEVFQRALRSGEFVTLRDELSYVESYLALERARLDNRLQVNWSIQTETETHHAPSATNESPLLDHPVPTLILQPIVENAVIHGVAKRRGGGTVSITVKQEEDDFLLQVEDNGPGIDSTRLAEILNPEQKSGKSIGLRNVDGRLRALYGDEYHLVISSEVEGGTCAQIRIPIDSKRED